MSWLWLINSMDTGSHHHYRMLERNLCKHTNYFCHVCHEMNCGAKAEVKGRTCRMNIRFTWPKLHWVFISKISLSLTCLSKVIVLFIDQQSGSRCVAADTNIARFTESLIKTQEFNTFWLRIFATHDHAHWYHVVYWWYLLQTRSIYWGILHVMGNWRHLDCHEQGRSVIIMNWIALL
jgi:hypothetical protein